MIVDERERVALSYALSVGAAFGYGNLITHLQTAWARKLMEQHGVDEASARAAAGGPGMPFGMQADILERGEWDDSGARYRAGLDQ